MSWINQAMNLPSISPFLWNPNILRIERCLSDIEKLLKEDLTSEGAKNDFLQWRLKYDAAVIEIEQADLCSALRAVVRFL